MRYVCVSAMGEERACGFVLQKLWCGREITPDDVGQLLAAGRTDLLDDFRGRTDRPFKAWIEVGPEGKAAFEFSERRKKTRKG